MSVKTSANQPLRTDKQADKAARREVRLQRQQARIEARKQARVEKLEARIKKIKADADERIDRVFRVRGPLRQRLIDYVINFHGRKKSLTLSTGTELVVTTNYRVYAPYGDEAAVHALEDAGLDDYVRVIVKKEPNRALLKQAAHRHVVDKVDELSLEPVRSLKINLSEQ